MPAKPSPSRAINFLPGSSENSQVGRIIKWLLSTFRAIVILVQVLVVGAFVARVFLDTQIADLNKDIEGKYAIVTSYRQVESDFLNKQQRLQTFQSLQAPENSYVAILEAVAQNTPVDVRLLSVNKAGSLLVVKGETLNEASINAFNGRLGSTGLITNVQVMEITDRVSEPTQFTLHASVPTLAEALTP